MLEEITENKDNMYYYKDFFDPLTCVSDQDTHILSKHLSTHEKKQEKVNGHCCFSLSILVDERIYITTGRSKHA